MEFLMMIRAGQVRGRAAEKHKRHALAQKARIAWRSGSVYSGVA
jgi:hypothetical protein